ncbi:MAG: hypothetical protein A2583_12590 [Bdellovibrionales bacterium RIFOXYD1_FULL_53_11]|nr:MAG: hypothetical protein A2583_12590 [Bdellovibrionales bacterium RIFOXYD1_FULL_53_11]
MPVAQEANISAKEIGIPPEAKNSSQLQDSPLYFQDRPPRHRITNQAHWLPALAVTVIPWGKSSLMRIHQCFPIHPQKSGQPARMIVMPVTDHKMSRLLQINTKNAGVMNEPAGLPGIKNH